MNQPYAIFPHIRPSGILFLLDLQLQVKMCLVQALLEMRVSFEGGPYMREHSKCIMILDRHFKF